MNVMFSRHALLAGLSQVNAHQFPHTSDIAIAALRLNLDAFRGYTEGPVFRTVDGRPLRNHHINVMFSRFALLSGVARSTPIASGSGVLGRLRQIEIVSRV